MQPNVPVVQPILHYAYTSPLNCPNLSFNNVRAEIQVKDPVRPHIYEVILSQSVDILKERYMCLKIVNLANDRIDKLLLDSLFGSPVDTTSAINADIDIIVPNKFSLSTTKSSLFTRNSRPFLEESQLRNTNDMTFEEIIKNRYTQYKRNFHQSLEISRHRNNNRFGNNNKRSIIFYDNVRFEESGTGNQDADGYYGMCPDEIADRKEEVNLYSTSRPNATLTSYLYEPDSKVARHTTSTKNTSLKSSTQRNDTNKAYDTEQKVKIQIIHKYHCGEQ